MKFNRESAILCCGMRGAGKTWWIKEHIKAIPAQRCFIYDYNCNDYQEFVKNQNIWNNKYSTKEEFDEFLKIPYGKGNCFVIMEEADQYLKISGSQFTKHFIGTARNRGIGFICSTKRPFGINPDYRSAFDKTIIFHTNDPEDIDYLEKWCGQPLPQISKLAIGRTAKDQKGEYIEIDMVTKEISGVKKL